MKRTARSISAATASYRSPAGEVRDEVLVPVVHQRQVGHAGGGQGAHQVHRRAGVGVGADHARRVGDPRGRVGDERVHDVAAVGRQAQCVDRGAARLGVLPGDPADLDHRHARAVGEHDRHLQQGADRGTDVRLGVVDEGLGAVAALQQEGPALRDGGEPALEAVDLRRQGHRRHALQHGAHVSDVRQVRPLGLLGRRAGQSLVQPGAQLDRKRGQLGQDVHRRVDGPVHGAQG